MNDTEQTDFEDKLKDFAAHERGVTVRQEAFQKGLRRMPEVLAHLGFKALRPGQDRAVLNVMMGKDTIALLPTGGGKSNIYITPTLCMDHRTLVFSPLVSLMADQVRKLHEFRVRAEQISSGQTMTENMMALNAWEAGDLQVLMIAPERMENEKFRETMQRVKPTMIVVDEAHAISQWSDSFRPAYKQIGYLIDQVRPDVVLAMTATATEQVEEDIRRVLGIRHAAKVVYYPERKNLKILTERWQGPARCFKAADDPGNRVLLNDINSVEGSKIIYCGTRRRCDELYDILGNRIVGGAMVYHGGMDPDERTNVQNAFMSGQVAAIFATNAFGMGIDKPDIRGIFHRDAPGSIEACIQEQGRAGRDGKDSFCKLYTSEDAYELGKFFVESTYPPAEKIQMVFAYLQSAANKVKVIKKTGKEISEGMRLNDRIVNACLGILTANKVLQRDSSKTDRTVRIVIKRDHEDPKFDDILQQVRQLGHYKADCYEVDLSALVNTTGVKYTTLTTKLRELDKNGYIVYQPPFRGSTTTIIGDLSQVDFERNEKNRKDGLAKLDRLWEYLGVPDEHKYAYLKNYFGVK